MGHSWLQASESPTRSDRRGKTCSLTKRKSEEGQGLGSPPRSASATVRSQAGPLRRARCLEHPATGETWAPPAGQSGEFPEDRPLPIG